MSEAALVRSARQEQVAVVTIDRPEKLSARNRAVVAALKDELHAAGADPDLHEKRAPAFTGR